MFLTKQFNIKLFVFSDLVPLHSAKLFLDNCNVILFIIISLSVSSDNSLFVRVKVNILSLKSSLIIIPLFLMVVVLLSVNPSYQSVFGASFI